MPDSDKKSRTKNRADTKPPKKGGKAKWIIIILVILAIVGAVAAVFIFNIFGIRDNIKSKAKDWPLVGGMIKDTDTEEDEYATVTKEELIEGIKLLEKKIEKMTEEMAVQIEKSSIYIEEINRLKEFEDAQTAFEAEKELFDAMMLNETEKDFSSFYETVHPELAKEIYEKVLREKQSSDEIKKYVKTFSDMDATDAANILEEMIASDLTLVVDILFDMNPENRGLIMAEMEPANGATIAKRMASYLDSIKTPTTD